MSSDLSEKIKKLKESGKSYNEIKNILNCSKGTISYYLGEGQKEKSLKRRRKNRIKSHPFQKKYEHFKYKKYKKINKTLKYKYNIIYSKYHNFLKKGNKVEEYKLNDVIEKIGNNPICYLTGIPIDINDTKSYQFDHIIPVSRGGTNELNNLGICLSQVNQAKRNMTPDEFINLCNLVSNYNKK